MGLDLGPSDAIGLGIWLGTGCSTSLKPLTPGSHERLCKAMNLPGGKVPAGLRSILDVIRLGN